MSGMLHYKAKAIHGNDIVLTFHKDYPWIFNEDPFPIIEYTLKNCNNLSDIDLDNIDFYNDGVVIEIMQLNNSSVFVSTDMGNIKGEIECEKILKEEREYNRQDLIDLLKEIIKQRNIEYETTIVLNNQVIELKHFLNQELNIVNRKLNDATWLSKGKKRFLEGEINVLQKVILAIDSSKNN
jgi:hypothetical protein